jgi:hypothetical protein
MGQNIIYCHPLTKTKENAYLQIIIHIIVMTLDLVYH